MNTDINEKCGDIRTRELVLYGDQEELVSFIDRYVKLLNIRVVATNYKDELKQQPYMQWGIECVLLEDIEFSNELIVICDRKKFGVHQKYLQHMGKEEYKDYISVQLVEGLIQQKKLMLCMGTQLVEQVYRLLARENSVTEEYSLLFYPESDVRESHMDRMQEYLHIGRCCDVYVRSDCEKEQFYRKVLNQNQLNADCKVITVADYGFGGYFPQLVKDRDKYSDYLIRERERLKVSYETLAFSKTDKELERYCEEKLQAEEIVAKIGADDYFAKNRITEYFGEEIKRFKRMEKNADIKLADFIELHQTECLCRNLNEWNEPVVSYVAEALVGLLELPELSTSREMREQLIEEYSGSEFPIYPSVGLALGLQDRLQGKKYKVTTYYKTLYLEFTDYIRYLVEYLYKTMDIMSFTGMDKTLKEDTSSKR